MSRDRLSGLVWQGALDNLVSARQERVKRLKSLISKVQPTDAGRAQLIENADAFLTSLDAVDSPAPAEIVRHCGAAANAGGEYLDVIQALDETARDQVVAWLTGIVTAQQDQAQKVIEHLPLPF